MALVLELYLVYLTGTVIPLDTSGLFLIINMESRSVGIPNAITTSTTSKLDLDRADLLSRRDCYGMIRIPRPDSPRVDLAIDWSSTRYDLASITTLPWQSHHHYRYLYRLIPENASRDQSSLRPHLHSPPHLYLHPHLTTSTSPIRRPSETP